MIIVEFIFIGQVLENNYFMNIFSNKISYIFFVICLSINILFFSRTCLGQQVSSNVASETNNIVLNHSDIVRFVDDGASIIKPEYKTSIASCCNEIEKEARIRVFIKTEIVKDLNEGQLKSDSLFSKWIRSIEMDRRGIFIYAMLPENSAHGKIIIKAGKGLKYLITKEIGENILNQIILPNNAENNDGKGFLDGVLSIKRVLLDELATNGHRIVKEPKAFDLKEFLWSYKYIIIGILIIFFVIYIFFFVERCPKCGGGLRVTTEVLKEAGENTLGLQRKIYVCENCGLTRRKKEPIYPSGIVGLKMRFSGVRRNVKID